MTPKKRSSKVWDYMVKTSDESALCTICNSQLKFRNGSTSNLRNHVKRHQDKVSLDLDDDTPKHGVGATNIPISTPAPAPPKPTTPRNIRPLVSGVWNYFVRCSHDAHAVLCRMCKKELKYNRGSTSNLRRHLSGKHKISLDDSNSVSTPSMDDLLLQGTSTSSNAVFGQTEVTVSEAQVGSDEIDTKPIIQHKPPIISTSLNKSRTYPSDSIRKRRLDNRVMKMIASDLQPFSIVEDQGFRLLVEELDSKYELPTRKKLSSEMLPAFYKTEAEHVKLSLQQAEEITITIDEWITGRSETYLTLSAHYISNEWQWHTFVLNTTKLSTDHNAETTAEELTGIFTSWEILDKVKTIVTGTANNMLLAAVRRLGVRHVSCFAHNLNLIVAESLNKCLDVIAVIQRVRVIVSHFHHSVEASDMLRSLLEQSNREQKKLLEDVETRWSSTIAMLNRYLDLHEPVTQALYLTLAMEMCLSDEEVNVIRKILDALGPFEEAMTQMSSESQTALAKIIPITKGLNECLYDVSHQNFQLVAELQVQMHRQFGDVEKTFIFGASTLLDPRFKSLPFKDAAAVQFIESEITNLLKLEIAKKTASEMEAQEGNQASASTDGPVKKRSRLWEKFNSQVEALTKTTSKPENSSNLELTQFHQCQILTLDDDPLQWWRENARLYPMLSKIAKRFLAIPATSVPPERLFSKTGELDSERRSFLKPKHLDKLLFLKKNLR